jgi:hypothetical protein
MGNRVSASTRKPGRMWYLVPLMIALVSVLFVPLAIVKAVTDKNVLAVQFAVPGETNLEVQRPGKYVLWNETQTIFQGQVFSFSPDLPNGMKIELTDLKTSNAIPMTADTSTSMSSSQESRHSVGYFEITEPGKYRVKVDGQFPQRVFYFRESLLRQLGPIFRVFMLATAGLVIAILMTVFIFIKRLTSAPDTQLRH